MSTQPSSVISISGEDAGDAVELDHSQNSIVQNASDPPSGSFSNTWFLFFTVLGCAVGTGNLWRFPRMVAQEAGENGGGVFLIQWIIFLFTWAIPLIVAEYAVGKFTRVGVPLSFVKLGGPSKLWMGLFMALVTTCIGFYYAVISGWCWIYFIRVVFNPLPTTKEQSYEWFDSMQGVWSEVAAIAMIIVSCLICYKGVKALERVNIVLVPTLLVIVLGTLIWAMTLPGAMEGVKFLFTPDWKQFLNPTGWVNALSQISWDTSAAYGAFLTYAIYMQHKEPTTKLGFLTPITNNCVSLMCGVLVFSISFSLLGEFVPPEEKLQILKNAGPASTGLTFIWIPLLYSKIGFGRFVAIVFFMALAAAALSSLLALVELSLRVATDSGLASRNVALACVTGVLFVVATPSALSMQFLINQDYVWGIALILSGLFFSLLIIQYGVEKFREDYLVANHENDWVVGRWWIYIMKFVIPVEVAILLGWWVVIVPITSGAKQWWNPFQAESIATCIFQWAIGIGLCYGINHVYLNRRELAGKVPEGFRRFLVVPDDEESIGRQPISTKEDDGHDNDHDHDDDGTDSDMHTVRLSDDIEEHRR